MCKNGPGSGWQRWDVAWERKCEALDLSDDRLALGLDLLGKDESWKAFEAELNGRIIRVYDLKVERVRIDTTTGSGYWQVDRGWLVPVWAQQGSPTGFATK